MSAARKPATKGKPKRGRWVVTSPGTSVWQGPGQPPGTSPRAIELREQRDTRGLGRWERPESWDRMPFSHTVTTVDGLSCGWDVGWNIYNADVLVTLVVQPTEGPFERGQPYVWCKTARGGFGDAGTYATAPIFGRFIEKDRCGRARALIGTGKSMVIGEKYDQCYRAVGRVGFGSEFYQRSEFPIPIPSEAVRKHQPMHFDWLQHQVRRLGQILTAMGHATDMVDELDDAEKAAKGKIDYEARLVRQARAYEVLEPLITRAMAQSGQVAQGMGDFLKASPVLAHYLT